MVAASVRKDLDDKIIYCDMKESVQDKKNNNHQPRQVDDPGQFQVYI